MYLFHLNYILTYYFYKSIFWTKNRQTFASSEFQDIKSYLNNNWEIISDNHINNIMDCHDNETFNRKRECCW